MFTIPLLIIAGLYFSLFVFANKCSKYWSVRLLLWAVLLSPLVYKTWDMPVGHARFKALCKKEGGMNFRERMPMPAWIPGRLRFSSFIVLPNPDRFQSLRPIGDRPE